MFQRNIYNRSFDPFGRILVEENSPFAKPDRNITEQKKISDGVGKDLKNNRNDVVVVEKYLEDSGYFDTRPTGGPTGIFGPALERGIKSFQKENDLKVDGMLFPKGETILTLEKGAKGENAAENNEGSSDNAEETPPMKPTPRPEPPGKQEEGKEPENGEDSESDQQDPKDDDSDVEACEEAYELIEKLEVEIGVLEEEKTKVLSEKESYETKKEELEKQINRFGNAKSFSDGIGFIFDPPKDGLSAALQTMSNAYEIVESEEFESLDSQIKDLEKRIQELETRSEQIQEAISAKEREIVTLELRIAQICN